MRLAHKVGAALVGLAVLAGCTLAPSAADTVRETGRAGQPHQLGPDNQSPNESDPTREPAKPPEDAPPALAKFYTQKPKWTDCGAGGFECATVQVPLDYAKPEGKAIELAVLRLRARKPSQRIGSLLVNPGGPGGSGVEYARYSPLILGQPVLDRYDVVGFDPRGVGQSTPVDCVSDEELDKITASDGSPDSPEEINELFAQARAFGQGCQEKSGDLIAHVSTQEAARDMDILRGLLGDEELHYLGKSYGTFLGATYAELFPKRAGRLVLDGALDPQLTGVQLGLEQAKGFEVALRAFLEDCVKRSDCPLGTNADEAYTKLREFLDGLDQDPLPGAGDRQVTQAIATIGVVMPLYVKSYWPRLRAALKAGLDGSGERLLSMVDEYNSRGPNGYKDNSGEVIYAVNCLDRPDLTSVADAERELPTFQAAAPLFGPFILWGSLACANWPVKPTGTPHAIRATGAKPILVVGTTRDPATPYRWAQALASQLDSGVLLTRDGDGHTAYKEGNSCVDEAVEKYLLEGKPPEASLRCPPG